MSFHSVWGQHFDKIRDTAPKRGPACQIELEFGIVRKNWSMREKPVDARESQEKSTDKVKIKPRIGQNDQKL